MGCWVMPGLSDDGKVIVRSDGTVVYTGKDIAYQLWNSACLGRTSTTDPGAVTKTAARLGLHGRAHRIRPAIRVTARRVYNVIDTRQSYLQDVWWRDCGARYNERPTAPLISTTRWWRSRRAAAPISESPLSEEDRKRPYVEVSGRRVSRQGPTTSSIP